MGKGKEDKHTLEKYGKGEIRKKTRQHQKKMAIKRKRFKKTKFNEDRFVPISEMRDMPRKKAIMPPTSATN